MAQIGPGNPSQDRVPERFPGFRILETSVFLCTTPRTVYFINFCSTPGTHRIIICVYTGKTKGGWDAPGQEDDHIPLDPHQSGPRSCIYYSPAQPNIESPRCLSAIKIATSPQRLPVPTEILVPHTSRHRLTPGRLGRPPSLHHFPGT